MMSREQIEALRKMSVEERWELTRELMTLAWRALLELPYQERERRLRLLREEHHKSCESLARALRERA